MKNEIIAFYKKTFGEEFVPYSYQIKVAEALLSGKNIILQVPTGAGKTWASIIPFLMARENPDLKGSFPSKMIYSLPLRTLANSIFEDVSKICDASIQTGEYSEDKYFEKDIIFSTIDQTLSNFLCFPLPISHRQANVNAGALIGSYLVFDEFHLLDENLSMATTIGTLRMLGNLCRCCIMTATLSEVFMKDLKGCLLNYEIITLDDFEKDKSKIKSLLPIKNKKKLTVYDYSLNHENIINHHIDKTIVICNRVENAQKIYFDLIEEQKNTNNQIFKNAEIICLHSRFFDNDRKEKEGKLKKLFGKSTSDTNAILIATQVIEAGMDISCSRMHTEISPISSFLQRAGRNARFSDEIGQIFIYSLHSVEEKELLDLEPETKEDKDEIRKLKSKYLPYKEDVTEKTFSELKKVSTLDGEIPKELIEAILGETEKNIIKKMESSFFNQNLIKKSWNDCQKNNYRSTIRDIQSVEVVLIDESQKDEIAQFPFRYQSVGMYKWSLVGWLNKITKSSTYDNETLVWELKEDDDVFLENDEDKKIVLREIKPNDFKNIPSKVFINANFFGYHKDFGFNWQYESTFNNISPKSEFKEKKDDFKPLEKDTFYQHNMGLINAFEQEFLGTNENRNDKLDFIFKELAIYLEEPELIKEDFLKLIKWMIILHDYGKLNENWQNPMQKYQSLKDPNWIKEVLGHTDFNSKDENDIELSQKSGLNKRPPHAGVGAYIFQEIIEEYYENEYLKSSISMAIAKHHSSELLRNDYPTFKISETNYLIMQKLLDKFGLDIDLEKNESQGRLEGFQFEGYKENVLYLFFVRILRLCDQKATNNLGQYILL
jgi:CRISPR-associated endonuclease/helicase Cas3